MKRISVPFGGKHYELDVFVKLSENHSNNDLLYREVQVKSAIPDYDWEISFIYSFGTNVLLGKIDGFDTELIHQIAEEIVNRKLLYYFILPSKNQLKEVISEADPKVNNSVILLDNGIFQVYEKGSGEYLSKMPNFVARFETLSANHGDVGPIAANDENFIRIIYLSLMGGWVIYLRSGGMNMYFDVNIIADEQQLKKEIDDALETRFK